jgi:diguanylate cyclase (GGDEF)-like protein/PAS domain S-box-containing protein
MTAIALVALLGTLVLIAVNAVLLDRMTGQVQVAQARAAMLSNADHEMLRLIVHVAVLDDGTGSVDELTVARGLLERQLKVSASTFPPGSPQEVELMRIRAGISALPWERLRGGEDRDNSAQVALTGQMDDLDRRLNVLRSTQRNAFYTAMIRSLATKRRSQIALVVLVSLVLVLGGASLAVLVRRRRSDIARAYVALEGEMAERQAAEQALRASEGRFRSLVQRASDLTVVTDEHGIMTYVSPAAERLLGMRPEELVDGSLLALVPGQERAALVETLQQMSGSPGALHTVELRLRTRDGRPRSLEAVCQNLLSDPDVRGLVWNGRDVTDRRALEDELTRQARHDSLTGLPNRFSLLTGLREAMASPAADGGRISVIMIDLDAFKNVNDSYGHPAGDELLQRAAERLRGCVLAGDLAARLGGDEFAVLVAGRPEHALAVARRVVDALGRPISVAGQEMTVGASAGVAHRDGHESAEDLLRDADIAMYVAKTTGKGHFEVFEPGMRDGATHRTTLQQHLARAVELGEIEVFYQPIVDLDTQQVTSLEALARWRHPARGLVTPDEFIPLAEESGAILGIGREVLRQACHAGQHWRATVPDHDRLGVAVNVSVHQVLSGHLVEHVMDALRSSGLPPPSLTLEITESTMLEPSERVTSEFARLKALGVRIAVDDFGSGYSSLGFVMSLDADVLKIDRTLLDFDTTRHGSLVQAICDLGRTLGLLVVAEGVETPEHLARARDALCDGAQGYHFARPMPVADVPAFLGRSRAGATRAVLSAG